MFYFHLYKPKLRRFRFHYTFSIHIHKKLVKAADISGRARVCTDHRVCTRILRAAYCVVSCSVSPGRVLYLGGYD